MIRRVKESFAPDFQTGKAWWTFTLDVNYTAGLLEIKLWTAQGKQVGRYGSGLQGEGEH